MPPTALPADETLKLPGQPGIAWAEFDPQWYLDTYASIREHLSDISPEAVLRYYLETGRQLGHSPNRFFDEAWHLRAYPDVAAALGRGAAASAFDLYSRNGFRTRAPHWLFDERLYRRRHPDLTGAALELAGLANGYDQYLRHGAQEQHVGHLFLDPALYQAQLAPDEARDSEAAGLFHHYLRRIATSWHEARTTLYFDPAW